MDARSAAVTLVWIDAREAIVIRWIDGVSRSSRIGSDVPSHHRATGHVRHDPGIRHGGGGPAQTAGEPRRLEHLARFLDAVAARLPRDDDLLLLGPGTVRRRLARKIAEEDAGRQATRAIQCEAAAPMTRRQLIARHRHAIGEEPRRSTVGAYRWSSPPAIEASGRQVAGPRRVTVKRRHEARSGSGQRS